MRYRTELESSFNDKGNNITDNKNHNTYHYNINKWQNLSTAIKSQYNNKNDNNNIPIQGDQEYWTTNDPRRF